MLTWKASRRKFVTSQVFQSLGQCPAPNANRTSPPSPPPWTHDKNITAWASLTGGVIYPFKLQWLLFVPPRCNVWKWYVSLTQYSFVFCVDLRTNGLGTFQKKMLFQAWGSTESKMAFIFSRVRKLRKRLLASRCLSVLPSVRTDPLCSHWRDFCNIEKIQVSLKSDKTKG